MWLVTKHCWAQRAGLGDVPPVPEITLLYCRPLRDRIKINFFLPYFLVFKSSFDVLHS